MNLRRHRLNLLLLVFLAGLPSGSPAQSPASPTPEQLMQLMRSQPAVDLSLPVIASAAFDPPAVHPGEKAIYRVSFNATAVSVNWPAKIPAPPELKIHPSASGQTMQAVVGEFQNLAMFDFEVRADAAGQFTVPEFFVQVYDQPVLVPAAKLDVKAELPEPHETARRLLVEPSATNVYLGEQFSVSVMLPASAAGIQAASEVQLNGDGFVADKNDVRQSIRPVTLDGRRVTTFVYQTSIIPIAAGTLNLSAQGFMSAMQFGGPTIINGQPAPTGGTPRVILLDSEPVAVQVRPLPAGDELPGFNGLVGNYICDPPSLSTNLLKVGEPVQLNVVIRSERNPDRIVPPTPLRADGWQIFPATPGKIVVGPNGPGKMFQYTLIPLANAGNATPAIPFSSFDPGSGQYVDLTIPSLPVTVLAGDLATNADATLITEENSDGPEQKLGLSKLAASPGEVAGGLVPWQVHGWFPLVQLFPVAGFCGLWWWDRRRRHLERHPEIVRRRQARRALRRERRRLEQAAAAGDAESFVRHAIAALQIATASHYPAVPRALVAGDVLQILTNPEREGKQGELVRRFFDTAAAADFANRDEGRAALLLEKTAFGEVISTLEARL